MGAFRPKRPSRTPRFVGLVLCRYFCLRPCCFTSLVSKYQVLIIIKNFSAGVKKLPAKDHDGNAFLDGDGAFFAQKLIADP